MGDAARTEAELAEQLLDLYPTAAEEVYRYLHARTGDIHLAEDLTSTAFMEAVAAIERGTVDAVSVGWLVVVARRRLVDHWRRQEREQRKLQLIHDVAELVDDPWTTHPDVGAARQALTTLAPQYRLALTLRYLDGLPLNEVAAHLGRSPQATESLLQRARAALRDAYDEGALDAD